MSPAATATMPAPVSPTPLSPPLPSMPPPHHACPMHTTSPSNPSSPPLQHGRPARQLSPYHPQPHHSGDSPDAHINATLREPFLVDVQNFASRRLDDNSWSEFEQMLLHWAGQIQTLTDNQRPNNNTMHAATRQYAARCRRSTHPSHVTSPQSAPNSTPPNRTRADVTPLQQPSSQRSGHQRLAERSRLLQRLYRQNPGACMRKILDDKPQCNCNIPGEDLTVHFTQHVRSCRPADNCAELAPGARNVRRHHGQQHLPIRSTGTTEESEEIGPWF